MSDTNSKQPISLEAKSPFELRVNLGKDVPESDVRTALASGDMGFLHSFTSGSTVDGPGVRVVAWTTGCMWRCLYCHNPDTWTLTNGVPVTLARATEVLGNYRHGLKVMSGGFTLSGGEPLMQHRFAVRLLTGARAIGIHTALDTNGFYGDRLTDADLEAIDLVLLAARGKPMWVRFVLVPGLTDHPDDVQHIADFTGELGNVKRVDVLPFHQMGRHKWTQLGLEYQLEKVEPPSQAQIEAVRERFLAHRLEVC